MPKHALKSGFVAELKAKIEKQTQERNSQTEVVYKELIETPDLSHQETPSTSQIQASDSIIYAELALAPGQYSSQEKVAMDITEYATIFGCSEKESLQSQIAILKDQKKQYFEKLNQAIDENKKKAIDGCCSQLTAIETSMATKINYSEKLNNPESKTETQEVPLDQVGTNPQGPAVDRSVKPRNVDFSKEDRDELVEQRQQTEDKINRVKFSKSTIERDDLKEQQKKQASESEQNFGRAKPTTLESRLEEFFTIWETPKDKSDLVTTSARDTEKETHQASGAKKETQETHQASDTEKKTDQAPDVDRSKKPGPAVQRELKPRLAQSSFFSLSSVQDEKEKEKQKKAFAHRQ